VAVVPISVVVGIRQSGIRASATSYRRLCDEGPSTPCESNRSPCYQWKTPPRLSPSMCRRYPIPGDHQRSIAGRRRSREATPGIPWCSIGPARPSVRPWWGVSLAGRRTQAGSYGRQRGTRRPAIRPRDLRRAWWSLPTLVVPAPHHCLPAPDAVRATHAGAVSRWWGRRVQSGGRLRCCPMPASSRLHSGPRWVSRRQGSGAVLAPSSDWRPPLSDYWVVKVRAREPFGLRLGDAAVPSTCPLWRSLGRRDG